MSDQLISRDNKYLIFLSTILLAIGMLYSCKNTSNEPTEEEIAGTDYVELYSYIDYDVQSDDSLYPEDNFDWNYVTNISSMYYTRIGFSLTAFKGKLYIIGGSEISMWDSLNDVWVSTDGISWEKITSQAPFPPRSDHQAIVFNNRLWVIGGKKDVYSSYNDIWYTENGIDWTQVSNQQNWAPRGGHECVVFNNKLWIIGGLEGDFVDQITNDVWYSEDGETWEIAAESPFPGHLNFECVVKDNKIWLIGGNLANDAQTITFDIYYSSDGIDWELVGDSESWPERADHQCVVYDNKIWIMGGYNYGSGHYNDVWYSENGIEWNRLLTTNNWPERDRFSACVFNNLIYVIGGYVGYPYEIEQTDEPIIDVWYLGIN
jgi:hypothetical protein